MIDLKDSAIRALARIIFNPRIKILGGKCSRMRALAQSVELLKEYDLDSVEAVIKEKGMGAFDIEDLLLIAKAPKEERSVCEKKRCYRSFSQNTKGGFAVEEVAHSITVLEAFKAVEGCNPQMDFISIDTANISVLVKKELVNEEKDGAQKLMVAIDGRGEPYFIFPLCGGYRAVEIYCKKSVGNSRFKLAKPEVALYGGKKDLKRDFKEFFLPAGNTPSQSNAGVHELVRHNIRDEFMKALTGFSVPQINERNKTLGGQLKFRKRAHIADGAERKLPEIDFSRHTMCVVSTKSLGGAVDQLFMDGNGFTKIDLGKDISAVQCRLDDYSKGIIIADADGFDYSIGELKKLIKKNPSIGEGLKFVGKHAGKRDLDDVDVLIDDNMYKMASNRNEGYGKNWLMHSISECSKSLLKLSFLLFAETQNKNAAELLRPYIKEAFDGVLDRCVTPSGDADGGAYMMVNGLNRQVTLQSLQKALTVSVDDDPACLNIGGKIAKLVGAKYYGLFIPESRYVNSKTLEWTTESDPYAYKCVSAIVNPKSGIKEGLNLMVRYPSGHYEKCYMNIVHDIHVKNGLIAFGVNQDALDLFETIGGADTDGDSVHLIPVVTKNKKGKNIVWEKHIMYRILVGSNYRSRCIHNVMPVPERKDDAATMDSAVLSAINMGAKQVDALVGSHKHIFYCADDMLKGILKESASVESGATEYHSMFDTAKEISQSDVLAFIENVGHQGFVYNESTGESEMTVIDYAKYAFSSDSSVAAFKRDLAVVSAWGAEATTGICSTGTPIDARIIKWYTDTAQVVRATVKFKTDRSAMNAIQMFKVWKLIEELREEYAQFAAELVGAKRSTIVVHTEQGDDNVEIWKVDEGKEPIIRFEADERLNSDINACLEQLSEYGVEINPLGLSFFDSLLSSLKGGKKLDKAFSYGRYYESFVNSQVVKYVGKTSPSHKEESYEEARKNATNTLKCLLARLAWKHGLGTDVFIKEYISYLGYLLEKGNGLPDSYKGTDLTVACLSMNDKQIPLYESALSDSSVCVYKREGTRNYMTVGNNVSGTFDCKWMSKLRYPNKLSIDKFVVLDSHSSSTDGNSKRLVPMLVRGI